MRRLVGILLVAGVARLTGRMFVSGQNAFPGQEIADAELATIRGAGINHMKCDYSTPCTASGIDCGEPNSNGVCPTQGKNCGTCSGDPDRVCSTTTERISCTATPNKECCALNYCILDTGSISEPPTCKC